MAKYKDHLRQAMTLGSNDPDLNQRRLESSRVSLVLRQFGLTGLKPQLCAASDELLGYTQFRDCRMPLCAFNRVLPGFPVELRVRCETVSIETTGRMINGMCRDSLKAYCHQWYDEEACDASGDRPLAVVFSWMGLRGGGVVHDFEYPCDAADGCRLMYTRRKETLVIEPFVQFLRAISVLPWTVASLRSEYRPPPEAQSTTIVKASTILSFVDNMAEGRLLSYLLDTAKSGADSGGSHPWLSVTEPELAKQCGMSLSSVKRGIASLAKKNLIRKRHGNRKEINLCVVECAFNTN